jgi:polyisoprenoid-binding protein YceI
MAQDAFQTQPDSRFWIEGSATGTSFVCRVDSLAGTAELGDSSTRSASGTLHVPVARIDCGNPRMTDDMREALNAAEHPEIRFSLTDVDVSPVQAHGTLAIAGAEQSVSIHGTLRPMETGEVRVTGSARLRLSDFGITPPTKFFGLVRVHNEIDVHFDLIGARRQPAQHAGGQ